jgi:hypothetical protein
MHAGQKAYLEERHEARKWHGRGGRGRRAVLTEPVFDGSELRGWTLHRLQRDDHAKPPVVHSLWRHGESMSVLLAIDLFVCNSVKAAHDQLIQALGNMESDAVERQTDKSAPGDVAFALGETMVLFARANVVVLVRNAGPEVVSVFVIARRLDALLLRPGPERKR